MKPTLKDFFSFTKKELNGLVIFCFILMVIAFAPLLYSKFSSPAPYNYSAFEKEIAEFRASARLKKSLSYHRHQSENVDKVVSPQYFTFNPNNLSEELWRKLGLSSGQIKVIKNFEAKGGRFYKKDDLKKMYSISSKEYQRLEPYISIPAERRELTDPKKVAGNGKASVVIDLNQADSLQLEALKGIGPAFASRIIKYRNRLGGFYQKEQLLEVYGMDSVRYTAVQNQISVNPAAIQRININEAGFEELKKFPYFSYKQMNAIIQYRKQHGYYASIDDLKKVKIIPENILQKAEPYLSF